MVQQNHIHNEADQPPYRPMIPPLTPPHAEPTEPLAQQPTIYVERDAVWEYKIVDYAEDDAATLTTTALDTYGAQGWELCGVLPLDETIRFFFKRFQSL